MTDVAESKAVSSVANFQRTLDDSDFERRMFGAPLRVFLETPCSSIRKRCVEYLEEQMGNQAYRLAPGSAQYWEDIIAALIQNRVKQHAWEDGKFAERILNIYIGMEKTTSDQTIRALEFGIGLYRPDPNAFVCDFVPGVVCKHVRNIGFWKPNKPDTKVALSFYCGLKGLRELIERELMWISTHGNVGGCYGLPAWNKTGRALQLINIAGDFRFLPQIEKLLVLLTAPTGESEPEKGELLFAVSNKSDDFYQQEQNIVAMRCVAERLHKTKQEEPTRFG